MPSQTTLHNHREMYTRPGNLFMTSPSDSTPILHNHQNMYTRTGSLQHFNDIAQGQPPLKLIGHN